MSRVISHRLKIAWDGTNFVDESTNLISASGSFKLTAPGSSIVSPQGIVDRMALVLYNRDSANGRRYSPLNTTGPLYTYISGGGAYHRPVTFEIAENGGAFQKIFTGVIKIPQEGTPTSKNEATVSIECRSVDELYLQLRISTDGFSIQDYVNNDKTESDIIKDILEHPDVGLTSANYIVDNGTFNIRYFWMEDESVMEELWQLAAACGGRLYADVNGKIVYKNMQEWMRQTVSTETFTRDKYSDLRIRYDDNELYNKATVEASPRRMGVSSVIWEPDEQITIPANSTRVITARLRQPCYFVNGVSFQAITTGGTNITANVVCNLTIYSQRIEMSFVNSHATNSANIMSLQLTGISILGSPTIEENKESADAFWTSRKGRTRSSRGNVYVQGRAQAKSLAEFLLDTSEKPKLIYTIANAPGLYTRKVGDRITINDTKIMSASRDAYISSISWNYSAGTGFIQTIEAIDANSVLKYSPTDYFIIGTDVLGNGTTTGERTYY